MLQLVQTTKVIRQKVHLNILLLSALTARLGVLPLMLDLKEGLHVPTCTRACILVKGFKGTYILCLAEAKEHLECLALARV